MTDTSPEIPEGELLESPSLSALVADDIRTNDNIREYAPSPNLPSLRANIREQIRIALCLYRDIGKNPKLLIQGFLEVMKDVCWRVPLTLWKPNKNIPRDEQISQRMNAAWTLADFPSIAAAFAAQHGLAAIGTPEWISAPAGIVIGSYGGAILSGLALHRWLTRNIEGYSGKDVLLDSAKLLKNLLPPALAWSALEIPFVSLLVICGMSAGVASAIALILEFIGLNGLVPLAGKNQLSESKKE